MHAIPRPSLNCPTHKTAPPPEMYSPKFRVIFFGGPLLDPRPPSRHPSRGPKAPNNSREKISRIGNPRRKPSPDWRRREALVLRNFATPDQFCATGETKQGGSASADPPRLWKVPALRVSGRG